jgi:choline-sulfatase
VSAARLISSAAEDGGENPAEDRYNILLITADQFAAHALGCAGAEHLSTPHLDRLAAAGRRFERAYATFPLCVPSRASMLTGRMPHELGITGNRAGHAGVAAAIEPGQRADSVGRLLSDAGYDCVFAGKWHATRASARSDDGFSVLRPFGDAGLADACSAWLAERNTSAGPFFLTASFDDPHTICEYARSQPLPYGDVETVDVRDAPGLPANFGARPYEPEALRHEQHASAAVYGTQNYTHDDWRRYRDAYARLVERTDASIGVVLDALEAAGLAENTIVLFTSDHGDGDASHAWNQKTALFQECVRVPLLIRGPGVVPGLGGCLVSVGLDLLPTLCAIAGVPVPMDLAGRDLLSEGDDARQIVIETMFEQNTPPFTRGRALIAGDYKYTVYNWGRWREQLHDLRRDPLEMCNLAVESAFDHVLEQMRQRLLNWCVDTDDVAFLKALVLPRDVEPAIRESIFAVPY